MKIEILYPDVANLYGDLMNMEYLSQCSGAAIINTTLKQIPHFTYEDVDLIYIGCTTERGQSLVRDALTRYLDAFKRRIEKGGIILVTGNALDIFGKYIEDDEGEIIQMLGINNTYATRRLMNRYNSLYLGEFKDREIIGFKSQFGHSYGHVDTPLFNTIKGAGLNPEETGEGFRINNFMGTYIQGPLLIMNPYFNLYIQELMGVEKPSLLYEDAVMDVYNTRLAEFKEPDRGFEF